MPVTAWSSFYDYIMPDLMGATTTVVDFELRRVAINFCEETQVHTEEVTPINVLANTAAYTLAPSSVELEPCMVKAAWFDDTPLKYAPMDVLNSVSPQWQDATGPAATAFTHRRPDEIILYPVPDTALTGGLRVEIAVRPSLAATGLTDWITTRYIYAIADGVKGKLMAQPGKPWTNLELAGYHTQLYESAKTRATIDANRSFTRAALSVRPRPAA